LTASTHPAPRAGEGDLSGLRVEDRDYLLIALAEIFALLAEVFLDPEADVKVRFLGILRKCPERCPGLAGLPGALRDLVGHCEAPQDQARSYVRLFLGGSGSSIVQLYESVYTYGTVMVPEVLNDLNALSESEDLGPRSRGSLPPDHLGCELEMLARLLTAVTLAGDPVATERRTAAVRALLSRHLIGFARHFTRRLDAARPHPYYRKAADALVEGVQACALVLG
jgi:TorA maturation chaperone TorD